MKTVFVPSDRVACSWVRAYFPGYWLRRLGLADVRFLYAPSKDSLEWADLHVFQRNLGGDTFRWWQELGKHGKRRVYELDDDIFCLPKSNPFEPCYTPEVLQMVRTMIREADLVTCSTQGLADSMSRFNKKVAVLPNGIDPDVFDLPRGEHPGEVRIGFMGSRTHDEDFAIALPALKRVIARHPESRMVFVGDPPTGALAQFPKDQVVSYGWVAFEELHPFLAGIGLDIMVVPLTNHPFNRGKSATRFLEASALGAVTIASPVSDFARYCQDGVTALLPKTMAAWEECLEALLESQTYREEMAANAKNEVRAKFGYDVLASVWAETYAALLGAPVS
jgi:glycosyltransferase involved in cell wall biosynthesis